MMVLSFWMNPIVWFCGVVGDPTSRMGVPTGVLRGVARGVRGVPAGTRGRTWMGGPAHVMSQSAHVHACVYMHV